MLLSILWVVFVGALAREDVYREWSPGVQRAAYFGSGSMAAVPCDQSSTTRATIKVAGRTYYMLTVSDVRERFPEYRDLPLPKVVRRSSQRVGLDLGWSYRETQESL